MRNYIEYNFIGQWIIDKARPDITRKFSSALPEEGLISQYIYQCNSQTPRYVSISIIIKLIDCFSFMYYFFSGESAFRCMMFGLAWAKNPMVKRIDSMNKNIPITLLYGSRTWVDNTAGQIVKEKRIDSYVKVQVSMIIDHL